MNAPDSDPLAPLLMKTDPELALYGRYVVSARLKAEGFELKVPRLEEAVAAIFAS